MSAFRFTTLSIRDPHTFINFLGCRDFTDTPVPLTSTSTNSLFQAGIQNDNDSDGFLDTNFMMVFKPLDPTGSGPMEIHLRSACTAPIATTSCSNSVSTLVTLTTYTTNPTDPCLEVVPGTIHPYTPAITYAGSPCFVSGVIDLELTLAGITLTMRDVMISGTFQGDPAASIINGFMRGFIRESDADNTFLPANLPVLGGDPLSSILAGGTGCCASVSDMDTLDGYPGWWFYINYAAAKVTYVTP